MLRTRVIPTLLLRNGGLVKGSQFKDHKYVGDPINAVKIFNEKEVDELLFLDIGATESAFGPNFDLIADIASEAFMPFGYGGGITKVEEAEKLFKLGVEKVVLNTSAHNDPKLIRDISSLAGAQSVVVSVDVKKSLFGKYEVYSNCGRNKIGQNPIEFAQQMEELGAGEIVLCSIDREGTGKGYDLVLSNSVASAVEIPVVAVGGAATIDDLSELVLSGEVSGVAAGNMFVFHGRHKAVLITYPPYNKLVEAFKKA